ncbi:hypothetical protein JHK87_004650 [Glycine soja]|nr:hypothetical protein JHK87_004650 [Glycine soja]
MSIWVLPVKIETNSDGYPRACQRVSIANEKNPITLSSKHNASQTSDEIEYPITDPVIDPAEVVGHWVGGPTGGPVVQLVPEKEILSVEKPITKSRDVDVMQSHSSDEPITNIDIEIIEGLQKKIFDHEKIVSMKVVDNEKLVKAIESLHKNFNTAVKELANTKNIVKALNDQLTVEEKKNKAHE